MVTPINGAEFDAIFNASTLTPERVQDLIGRSYLDIAFGPTRGDKARSQIRDMSFFLGGLLHRGWFTIDDAFAYVVQACARRWDTADDDDRKWIMQGLTDGQRKPLTDADLAVLPTGAIPPVVDDGNPAFAFGTDADYHDQTQPPQAAYGAFGGSVPLFYAIGVHWLQGESESGKSWAALAVALDHLRAGSNVIIIDYEDSRRNVRERLIQLGMQPHEWRRCVYVDGHAVEFSALCGHLASTERGYGLVLVDGVTSSLSAAGLKGRDEQELTQWADALPRRGSSAICVDHVVKAADDRKGMAIGSQAKKSVVTGSSWEVVCTQKFGRGSTGAIELILQKDKPGGLRGQGLKKITLSFTSDALSGSVELSAGLAGEAGLFASLYERGIGANVSQTALLAQAKELGHGYSNNRKGPMHRAYVEYVGQRLNAELYPQEMSDMAVSSPRDS